MDLQILLLVLQCLVEVVFNLGETNQTNKEKLPMLKTNFGDQWKQAMTPVCSPGRIYLRNLSISSL